MLELCQADYHSAGDYSSYANYYPDYTYNYSAPTYSTRQKRIFSDDLSLSKRGCTYHGKQSVCFQAWLWPWHLTFPSPWTTSTPPFTSRYPLDSGCPPQQRRPPSLTGSGRGARCPQMSPPRPPCITHSRATWREWPGATATPVCCGPCARPAPRPSMMTVLSVSSALFLILTLFAILISGDAINFMLTGSYSAADAVTEDKSYFEAQAKGQVGNKLDLNLNLNVCPSSPVTVPPTIPCAPSHSSNIWDEWFPRDVTRIIALL